ncbi:cell division protein FtsQ/DivIB [Streptomyces sulphureus]|uniref:cell division protein FtsQ/DivIB n=1 Tax=Streptomyces sulphureus TaxID=47758 RepID=UPI000367E9A7|nr:FtsQ-type POTRA domain-containing protein [Streptomyces sulphureus]
MAGPIKTDARRKRPEPGERRAPGSGPPAAPRPRGPARLLGSTRRLRLLLVAALVLALLAGAGAWLLYGSPWLRVEKVTVSGNGVLTDGELKRAAAVPEGAPLASVDASAVRSRLTERLPRVGEVEVVRSWPNGISLKVTERRPELVMERADDYVEVDGEGVRFATVRQPPKGVPHLVLEPEKNASLRHFGRARLRAEAARVLGDVSPQVRKDTRTVRVRSYDSVTLELTKGRTVMWGSGEHGSAKARTLTSLMKAADGAEHFDVRVPSAPAASGS